MKRFPQEFVQNYQGGDWIFRAGEETREMFIIQRGEVSVVIEPQNKGPKKEGSQAAPQEIELARLGQGEFLGEMALLESLPRSASARAVGPTSLLVLQPGGFLLKIRRDPTFAFEMLQRLSSRIRTANDRLLEAVKRESLAAEQVTRIQSAIRYAHRD